MTREDIERMYNNGGMSYTEYVDALNHAAMDEYEVRRLPPLPDEATGPERITQRGGTTYNLEAKDGEA
jgi:hypothetical protein